MDRRSYVGTLGVAGLTGLAGCLDTIEQFGEDTHDGPATLPPPDRSTDASYPTYGEEFPSFSIPDPIAETTVSLEDFVGDTSFLLTYFFTSCPDGACPALLLRLQWIQENAVEYGYEDDISLLAFTFDPERDTPDTLREYATERGIEFDADNWHFLRPDTYKKAEESMTETFDLPLRRVSNEDELEEDDLDEETDHEDHDHGEYTFTHNNVITLVNEDGFVERAYPQAVQSDQEVSNEQIIEETQTVVGVE